MSINEIADMRFKAEFGNFVRQRSVVENGNLAVGLGEVLTVEHSDIGYQRNLGVAVLAPHLLSSI